MIQIDVQQDGMTSGIQTKVEEIKELTINLML